MKQGEFEKKELVKKTEDFTKWYTDVILKSELADYAPVKGCQVIRPYGFSVWENIQKVLDEMIKVAGVKNAYFPLFIPESSLEKEKEHVQGFSPELAVVTIGGGKKLKEKLVIRPTSETIIYEMYARWLKSWRNLPILINQWANIVRWELRTRLFLRTTEFLWQEGHTVHETDKEAKTEVDRALKTYINLYQDYFAIDGLWGKKSEAEKFPGALATFTYEMLMPDAKALQGCTSHDLGQNFAKVFKISFLGRNGKNQMPYQTCWGFSTRSIGAMIMAHGDNQGLVMPPKLAPLQVVIIPVFTSEEDSTNQKLREKCNVLKGELKKKNIRAEIDEREERSLGWKFNEWELKGVPLRIEIGQRELQEEILTLVRRDNNEKIKVRFGNIASEAGNILDSIQKSLFEKSRDWLKNNTREVEDYSQFKKIMSRERGFVKAFWCEDAKCEAKIKEETKATTRCLPHNAKKEKGSCIYCKKPAAHRWVFAQAY